VSTGLARRWVNSELSAAALLCPLFLTAMDLLSCEGIYLPTEKKDPEISALEAVHAALKPLDPQARRKVLTSVEALLEIAPQEIGQVQPALAEPGVTRSVPVPTSQRPSMRPLSLVELMQDKQPHTSAQKI